jgi:hypothetical protein
MSSSETREKAKKELAELVAYQGDLAIYELQDACELPIRCGVDLPRRAPMSFRRTQFSALYEDTLYLFPAYWVDGRAGTIVATQVRWDGVPNASMKPVNEAATDIFAAWERFLAAYPHRYASLRRPRRRTAPVLQSAPLQSPRRSKATAKWIGKCSDLYDHPTSRSAMALT